MNNKELVDQISESTFKEIRKIETSKSQLAMKNYLKKLDYTQLE